ncbi:hypothetical protein ACJ6X8_07380 [Pseudomonas alvandae]|uniref:hypothetical protein n=1 Tax=Pseudomonas TaxID=286 RepID=UPI00389A00CD
MGDLRLCKRWNGYPTGEHAIGLAEQLVEGIVGIVEPLLFTLFVYKGNGQQVVGVVVGVFGGAIVGAFADQATEGITLEMVLQRGEWFGQRGQEYGGCR